MRNVLVAGKAVRAVVATLLVCGTEKVPTKKSKKFLLPWLVSICAGLTLIVAVLGLRLLGTGQVPAASAGLAMWLFCYLPGAQRPLPELGRGLAWLTVACGLDWLR